MEMAIAAFQSALGVRTKDAFPQEIKNSEWEAGVLKSLGSAYHSLGQYEKAVDFFQQSLPIYQEIKNGQGEVTVQRTCRRRR